MNNSEFKRIYTDAVKDAHEIDVDVPRHLGAADPGHGRPDGRVARVVDQNVDPPKTLVYRVDQVFDILLDGDIGLDVGAAEFRGERRAV